MWKRPEVEVGADTKNGRNLSRRRACALAGGMLLDAVAGGGLAGCSGEQSDTKQGFASDCEVKSYPLRLRVLADANLKRGFSNDDGLGRVEAYFARYQQQAERGQVTMAIKYLDSPSLLQAASNGFTDCDCVIALPDAISQGTSSGTLYGGGGDTSVRTFGVQLYEQLVVVRKLGGQAEMPKASTANGEDSQDGQFNRIQNLPSFEGNIAVASADLIEGQLVNSLFTRWGLMVDGAYAQGMADKVRVYDSIQHVVDAVTSDECQLGFIAQSSLWAGGVAVESIYEPGFATVAYKGASMTDAAEGGVARDFMEFITRCS